MLNVYVGRINLPYRGNEQPEPPKYWWWWWWWCLTMQKKTPWSESASELYRPSDSSLSAKLVPNFEDRVCHVVSVTDPCGRILGFLDQNHYSFFPVAPQLCSRGWVDPVPDPLLLGKSGIVQNRTRDPWICSKELWPLDHRGGLNNKQITTISDSM
jgi:hypothetical protein